MERRKGTVYYNAEETRALLVKLGAGLDEGEERSIARSELGPEPLAFPTYGGKWEHFGAFSLYIALSAHAIRVRKRTSREVLLEQVQQLLRALYLDCCSGETLQALQVLLAAEQERQRGGPTGERGAH